VTEELRIGAARLILGDARSLSFEAESVDLIFTDPPYGHNNNNGDLISNLEKALSRSSGINPPRPIANDGKEADGLARWLFRESKRLLRSGGCCCCCCGGGGPDTQFARWSLWMNEHLHFKQMVVWDKGPMGLGWHYRRSYETILVGQRDKTKCNWFDDSRCIENVIRPGQHGIRKKIPASDEHPTEKPEQLAALFIRLHSKPGEVVFDPFMGSGSTGVAALSLGRQFIGVELDKRWFDSACRKIERIVSGIVPPILPLPSKRPVSGLMYSTRFRKMDK